MSKQGMSSRVSPLASELLAQDSRPLPPGLKMVGNHTPKVSPIPYSRYHDPAFAQLEMERLWKRTWQFACREEDLPNVGDRMPYDVGADLSLIIVRSAPSEFKAFHNTCRHRGTRLVNAPGSGASITCPFHGWKWHPDGALRDVPCRWDFEGVSDTTHRLIEVRVETWEGFVFVNPDPGAGPLGDALALATQAFEGRGHRARFTLAHVSKKIRANWKTVLEAFLEAYHVLETHSEALPYTGDASTGYDVWESGGSYVSRLVTPSAVPSPHLGDDASAQLAVDGVAEGLAKAMPGLPVPTFDASTGTARAQLAEWRRTVMKQIFGHDLSDRCDAEMIDSIQFHVFPNIIINLGDGIPLIYQFLPWGADPNESVFNLRITAPLPAGGFRPPSAKVVHLDFDDSYTERAQVLGLLGRIVDQDMGNLPMIQRGMRSAPSHAAASTLGRYQEQRIQHFQNVLGRILGVG